MTQTDIDNKAIEYSESLTPTYVNGDFDKESIEQAFIDGAEWMFKELIRLPIEEFENILKEQNNETI